VTNVKDLGSKVTGTTLVPGEQVIDSRFVRKSSFSATGANVQVPAGMLRTTVALDPQRVIGGVLTPGATVAVTASFGDAGSKDGVTKILFHKVLVTNVQLTGNVNSNDNTNDQNTASSTKPGQAPTNQLLVTLALDGASSERLVYSQEFGKVYLSIEPSDAATGGSDPITQADVLR
jgi:pilus assembly protein CpaB